MRTVLAPTRSRARALAAGLLTAAILTVIALPGPAAATPSAPVVVDSSPAGLGVARTAAAGTGVLTKSALASSLLAQFGATGGVYGGYSVGTNGCTTLTKWYVGVHTNFAYGGGNGGDVATKLVQANPGRGLSITHTPRAGAIFSSRDSAWGARQYCGATKCGHTGVVVGVNGNQVEILETNTGLARVSPYAKSSTITWNAGQQVDFVYVGGPAGGGGGGGVAPAVAEAYVRSVYADLLGRSPDPEGLATWSQALVSGTPYSAVANGITASDEYRTRLIDASYRQYLGRGADPAGAQGWLRTMQSGTQIEEVQANFVASDEFYANAGGTDAGWVASLYTKVLGRTAATSEINAWVSTLRGGASRFAVARSFLFSTEHLSAVVDGYYVQLLGRHADPAGQAGWVQLIQSGKRDEEIIASIVSSVEYLNNL